MGTPERLLKGKNLLLNKAYKAYKAYKALKSVVLPITILPAINIDNFHDSVLPFA